MRLVSWPQCNSLHHHEFLYDLHFVVSCLQRTIMRNDVELIIHLWKDAKYLVHRFVANWSCMGICYNEFPISSKFINATFCTNSLPFIAKSNHGNSKKLKWGKIQKKLERAEQNIQNGNNFSVNPFLRKTFAPISILESFRLLYLNT